MSDENVNDVNACEDTGFDGSLINRILSDRREDAPSGSNSRFIGRRDNAPIDERPKIDFGKPTWSWVAYSKSTGYAIAQFAVNGDTEELALEAGTKEFERQFRDADILGHVIVSRLKFLGEGENGSSAQA